MSDFTLQPTPLEMDDPNIDQRFKNVKELRISDGKVRIKDGAIIISDETGTDRVVIGFLKDAF